jgi:hypothetical protein
VTGSRGLEASQSRDEFARIELRQPRRVVRHSESKLGSDCEGLFANHATFLPTMDGDAPHARARREEAPQRAGPKRGVAGVILIVTKLVCDAPGQIRIGALAGVSQTGDRAEPSTVEAVGIDRADALAPVAIARRR